jgi:hypothetical protein
VAAQGSAGGFVRVRAFAAVSTGFNELLGVVPCPAAVVQDRCQENTSNGAHHQHGGHGFGANLQFLEHQQLSSTAI